MKSQEKGPAVNRAEVVSRAAAGATDATIVPQNGRNGAADFLRAALFYANMGWPIFPVEAGGKRPLTAHGVHDATTDEATIRAWWRRWPNANIGLDCGGAGLVAVDFDVAKEHFRGGELLERLRDTEPTTEAATGGGGVHLLYRQPDGEPLGNGRGDLPAGVDVRGRGGYIVVAPSVHPSGTRYAWTTPPSRVPPRPIPGWLLAIIRRDATHNTTDNNTGNTTDNNTGNNNDNNTGNNNDNTAANNDGAPSAYARAALERELGRLAMAPEGRRNHTLNTAAFNLGQLVAGGALDREEVAAELLRVAERIGLGRREAERTIRSGLEAGAKEPRTAPTPERARGAEGESGQGTAEKDRLLLGEGAHDEGNARCVYALTRGAFAHTDAFGWLAWTGKRWEADGAEARVDRAIVAGLEARIAAALADGAEKHEKLIKACIPNQARVRGAKYLLASLATATAAQFDNAPDLLNCQNGTLNLRTGEIRPHDPADRLTHLVAVDYQPDADYSEWCAWLAGAVGEEAADWLQMAVGYSLTGHTSEECLFYLYGPPRAGKGLFAEVLAALLEKPLAVSVNFATFTTARNGDSQNFDLAPLKPARVVVASESNRYERFNEAKVKALTGGDEVYCAFKHRTHFNYRPAYKIWLLSNHPVNADPDDDAIWGRIHIVRFLHSYLGREDKGMKGRFKSQDFLRGVLAWAVEGARRWYESPGGLPTTRDSDAEKERQRLELDNVGAWLEECASIDLGEFTPHAKAFESYRGWCLENGVEPKRGKSFTQALERKGVGTDRRRHQGRVVRGFTGLKLLPLLPPAQEV